MKIWWQSFTDEAQNPPYFKLLPDYLNRIADAGTTVEVVGMSPPDRGWGRLAEFRCAALAIDNAIEAERRGYDAYVLGHFQDSGLFTLRSAVAMPVIGLGETTLHWAAQLGRNLALISIDPLFERWHLEQGDRYGLSGRVTQVVGMGATMADFAAAYADEPGAYAKLLSKFLELLRPCVAAGADVIVPAGGHPALLFSREGALRIGHAPVVNSLAVALKCAEVAVKLRRLTGLAPAGGPNFALAPDLAIADYRALMAKGREK